MTGIGNPEFHSRQMMQGWGMSLLLHLGLLLAVITVTPRMTIVLEQEPFKWDVTLVEAPQAVVNDDIPPPAPKVQPSTKRPVDPVKQIEPAQEMVARVAPQQSQQIIHPVIEPPKPQQKPDPLETMPPVETKVPEPVTKDVAKEPVKESVPEPPSVVEPVAPTYTYTAPAPEPPVAASAPPAAEPPAPAAPPSRSQSCGRGAFAGSFGSCHSGGGRASDASCQARAASCAACFRNQGGSSLARRVAPSACVRTQAVSQLSPLERLGGPRPAQGDYSSGRPVSRRVRGEEFRACGP